MLGICNGLGPQRQAERGFRLASDRASDSKGSTPQPRSVEEVQITIDLSWPEVVAIASAVSAEVARRRRTLSSLKTPRPGPPRTK